MIVKEQQPARHVTQDLEAHDLLVLGKADERPRQIIVRHSTQEVKGLVQEIHYKVDVNTLHKQEGVSELKLNEIGRVRIRTSAPLFVDSYRRNRITGSVIFIDPFTNETVGAGMVR
jgi:sulfate adenylyltransferase subunit 1 (EFTu-like GTPase family)